MAQQTQTAKVQKIKPKKSKGGRQSSETCRQASLRVPPLVASGTESRSHRPAPLPPQALPRPPIQAPFRLSLVTAPGVGQWDEIVVEAEADQNGVTRARTRAASVGAAGVARIVDAVPASGM
eukprot:6029728-Pleurochrysis_carterae.AAC.2